MTRNTIEVTPAKKSTNRYTENCLKQKQPTLSIIIPTLNEEGFIEQILQDILNEKANYEIIVSDSGSTDKTENIVNNIAAEYPNKRISFIRAPRKGVSIARNHGATHAKGKYIIFLDADTRLPGHFLQNAINEMEQRALDAAGCYLKSDSGKLIDEIFFSIIRYLIHNPLQYTKRPGSAGAGIIVKKNVHEEIYGFNENFKINEDLDYIKRISAAKQFRMLNSTHIFFSTRRFDEHGRAKIWFQYCISGLCYLFSLKYVNFNYEFGKFNKSNKYINKN